MQEQILVLKTAQLIMKLVESVDARMVIVVSTEHVKNYTKLFPVVTIREIVAVLVHILDVKPIITIQIAVVGYHNMKILTPYILTSR